MYNPDEYHAEDSTDDEEELEIVEEAWNQIAKVRIENNWEDELNITEEIEENYDGSDDDLDVSRARNVSTNVHFHPGWKDDLKPKVNKKPSRKYESLSSTTEGNYTVTKELGYGIRMVFPRSLYNGEIYIAEPLDPERRSKEFQKIKLEGSESYYTDIYSLVTKSSEGRTPIKFRSEYLKDIKFVIDIENKQNIPLEFIARIFIDGCWRSVETSFQDSAATFHAVALELVFILSRPKRQTFELTPDKCRFRDEDDANVCIDFPKGTVDKTYPIDIQISYPDTEGMTLRHQMFPNLHNIVALSQKIQVQHQVKKFNKPMNIQFSLEEFLPKQSNKHTLMLFRWQGDNVTVSDAKTVERKDKIIKADVNRFSSYSLALVKSQSDAIKNGAEEVKFCFCEKYRCVLIVLAKKDKENCVSIWCELTQIEYADCIVETRIREESLYEIRSSRSSDLELRQSQRLRIDVGGNSKRIKGTDDYCFITFIPRANRNHIFFPLQRHKGLGQSPYTILSFSSDVGPKHKLHMVHFDPWSSARHMFPERYPRPLPTTPVPDIHRSNSSQGWLDDDRNLLAISSMLPSTQYIKIGVCLGLTADEVDRIHQQDHINMETVMFRILQRWMNIPSLQDDAESTGKLNQLTNVLKDLHLDIAAKRVENFFYEGKVLTNQELR